MNRTVKHQITGEQITFVETSEQTQGKYLYIEVTLPPQGDGPPYMCMTNLKKSLRLFRAS